MINDTLKAQGWEQIDSSMLEEFESGIHHPARNVCITERFGTYFCSFEEVRAEFNFFWSALAWCNLTS